MIMEQKRKREPDGVMVVIQETRTLKGHSHYADRIKEYLRCGGTIKILAPEKERPLVIFEGLFEEFSYLFV